MDQHFQIPIRSGTHGHVSTSSYELLSDPWVNKLQFTMDSAVIRWIPNPNEVNLHRMNPLCKVISKAQSLYIKQKFGKDVQRNITDFFKAWMTTDSIKIFFYCILLSSYCLLHLKNSERRFQICSLPYNFLHAALRCSSFRFETVICLRLYLLCSSLIYNVVCY